jgi:ketosteroid isomerase-like protein
LTFWNVRLILGCATTARRDRPPPQPFSGRHALSPVAVEIRERMMVANPEGIKSAEELTRAISSLDEDIFASIYTDDAEIWHNITNAIQTKSENAALLGSIFALVDSLYYDNVVRHPTPEGFVQHHVVRGVFKDGTPVPDLQACIVARVTNGKISRLNEFIDAAQFQPVWDRLGDASLAKA